MLGKQGASQCFSTVVEAVSLPRTRKVCGAVHWMSGLEKEGYYGDLEAGRPGMLNTLQHKGYSMKICLTPNASHASTIMSPSQTFKMIMEAIVFYI